MKPFVPQEEARSALDIVKMTPPDPAAPTDKGVNDAPVAPNLKVPPSLRGYTMTTKAEQDGNNKVDDTERRRLIHCETTKGALKIEVHRHWAPLGADRFIELVKDGFYTDIAFFRSVKGFLTQFGISEDPAKKHWHREVIKDDPNLHLGIKKNVISFAGGGPNTRSTQLFIAFEDLDFLGKEPWETPFGNIFTV